MAARAQLIDPLAPETPLPEGLPPRPSLPRWQMSFGFMLWPTRFLEECWRTCGDWFTLRPTRERILAVTVDPGVVREVFQGDPERLRAGEGNVVLEPLLGTGSVLLLDGREHMRHRKLLLPPFHGERLRGYGEVMREVAEHHVGRWPRGRRFGVLASMQDVTLEVIVRTVFGVRDAERERPLGPALRRVIDVVGSRRRVLGLALTQGRGGPLSPWGRFLEHRRQADELLFDEIARRRARAESEHGTDVMSLLLAARDEDGEPLSDQEIRDELMTLLVAGHETTATALAWTLERVTREPRVLQRMVSERRAGGEEYLDAVIKETLRLRPVVPAVARRLAEPMEFGPYRLPAGVHIAPSIYLLHRRPDLYPDPEAYRPERFLGDAAPGTYEWIPFGGGVRRCLGAAFAQYEMKIVLQTVLDHVAVRPAPGRRPEGTVRRAITFAPSRHGRVVVDGV